MHKAHPSVSPLKWTILAIIIALWAFYTLADLLEIRYLRTLDELPEVVKRTDFYTREAFLLANSATIDRLESTLWCGVVAILLLLAIFLLNFPALLERAVFERLGGENAALAQSVILICGFLLSHLMHLLGLPIDSAPRPLFVSSSNLLPSADKFLFGFGKYLFLGMITTRIWRHSAGLCILLLASLSFIAQIVPVYLELSTALSTLPNHPFLADPQNILSKTIQKYSIPAELVRIGHISQTNDALFKSVLNLDLILVDRSALQAYSPGPHAALVLHEMGHFHHGHGPISQLIVGIEAVGQLCGLILAMSWSQLGTSFGLATGSPSIFLLSNALWSLLIQPLWQPLRLYLQRRREREADQFVIEQKYNAYLMIYLLRMAERWQIPITTHYLYKALRYSHPTVVERFRYLYGQRIQTFNKERQSIY